MVSNSKLLTAVWGPNCSEEIQYLRTYVNQLRKKIEDDPSNPLYLLTVIYTGYRFADAQTFDEKATCAAEQASRSESAMSADYLL